MWHTLPFLSPISVNLLGCLSRFLENHNGVHVLRVLSEHHMNCSPTIWSPHGIAETKAKAIERILEIVGRIFFVMQH